MTRVRYGRAAHADRLSAQVVVLAHLLVQREREQAAGPLVATATAEEHAVAAEAAQIVGMALGAEGSISRVMGPVFGSCMTYGFVEGEEPAAPGQLPIRELRARYQSSPA